MRENAPKLAKIQKVKEKRKNPKKKTEIKVVRLQQ